MSVTHRPKGKPLPTNHPLRGSQLIFGAKRSALSPTLVEQASKPPVHDIDPPHLPEWDGPVKVVFSIGEESSTGGSSYCWVEQRGDDFILFGNELGVMGEPCRSAADALSSSGAEFGMDYVTIESCLEPDFFETAIRYLIFENIARLTVNGVNIDNPTAQKAVALYKPKSF